MPKTKILFPILFFFTSITFAQKSLPIIKASSYDATIYENGGKSGWTITPHLKPDVHHTMVKGKSTSVTFKTDIDSITLNVKPEDEYLFTVLVNGKDSALTQIKGVKDIPVATFSPEYIKANNNKTIVEIPEVYELFNIVFALTPTARTDPYLVEKETGYYNEVISYFDKYSQEKMIQMADSLLKVNMYFHTKMDAYAFNLNKKGNILQNPVYDRASWGNVNTLRPFIPALQEFSRKSNFLEFYKSHKKFYNDQIVAYRDSIGIKEMKVWLEKNFPSTRYNSFKIIFSPLVGGNQSANHVESNGFKEAHAHVNFPYRKTKRLKGLSEKAILIKRGNIVFTELNHSYINPECEKYVDSNSFKQAFTNLEVWLDLTKAAKYYNSPYSAFNEYMNWGLVSLRYVDLLPPGEELNLLVKGNEENISSFRGFRKFAEFNQFLVQAYKDREPGQTVADLYPKIIEWFGNNK